MNEIHLNEKEKEKYFRFFGNIICYEQIHLMNIDGSTSATQIGSQLNFKYGSKQVVPSDSIRMACTLN